MRISQGPSLLVLLALLVPASAWANAPQDLFGMGSRQVSMGGTGVAASQGFVSTYYNPASLGFCPSSSVGMSLRRANYNLPVTGPDGTAETDLPDRRTTLDLGVCVQGPLRLSFGFAFAAGLESPQRLDEYSVDSDPRYPIYGTKQDMLSILGGWAFRPIPMVSVGVGAAVLVNSGLELDNNIPVITEGEEVENAIAWDLQPRIAPYVGVRVQPVPSLDIGLVYRGALYHKLEATAYTSVELADVDLQVDLLLESVAWYSPQQIAFGTSFRPTPELELAFDLTWYDWSSDPGPFIVATPYGDTAVAQALDYPAPHDPQYRDVTVPRLGVAYVLEEVIELRAGYAMRPQIVPVADERTNLIDGATNVYTVGAGYRFELPEDPLSEAPSEPYEGAPRSRIDAHVAVQEMPGGVVNREVESDEVLNNYTYGGTIVDVGLTLTLGW